MKHARAFGITLTEYGLILALVAGLAYGALMLTGGGNLAALLGFASQKVGEGGPLNALQPKQSAVQSESPTKPGSPSGPIPSIGPPKAGQEQACLPSGWCVNLPVVAPNTVLGSTSGSLGVDLTRQFSDVFLQIARQLESMPNADPTLVNLITKLANEGHKLGDSQQKVHDTCPPRQTCNSKMLDADLMAVTGQHSAFQGARSQLEMYLGMHPHNLPPEIVQLIKLEADQISKIAGAYNTSAQTDIDVSMSGGQVTQSWDYANETHLTHQSANTICTSGGQESQCVR